MNKPPLLKASGFTVAFSRYNRKWEKEDLQVIHGLDITVEPGEILAVVGSSGSGKSLLAHGILGILPQNAKVSGTLEMEGQPLTQAVKEAKRGREIGFIPQSVDFLDPLMKVGRQVAGKKGDKEKMKAILAQLGLDPEVENMYPFQLSGGMARRVLIGTALMEDPKLIIADEPTPGLEIAMAMETLATFRKLADEGKGILLITHDLDLALNVADRIAVFYAGTTVEVCPISDFLEGPETLRHPYSKALLQALPQKDFLPVEGNQPYAGRIPKGCVYQDRCSMKTAKCEEEVDMVQIRKGQVRCIHAT